MDDLDLSTLEALDARITLLEQEGAALAAESQRCAALFTTWQPTLQAAMEYVSIVDTYGATHAAAGLAYQRLRRSVALCGAMAGSA